MVSDGKFFITSRNATTFLQMSKQSFNHISLFVGHLIKRSRSPLLIRSIRNHRRYATLSQAIPIILRGATLVSRHLFRSTTDTTLWCANCHLIHCRKHQRIVACLSSTNQRRQWMKMIVAHANYFCGQTAFRLANSVIRRFSFYFFFVNAPAADLWALTIVPSTENSDQSILPSASKRINNLSRIKSQVPSSCQRR